MQNGSATVVPEGLTPLIPGSEVKVRKSSGYFEGVQCLRFAAALMVVCAHATFYAKERLAPGTTVWDAGTAGVNIFFVISGFVMMKTAPKFQTLPNGWIGFGLRRLARIVPLYWLMTSFKLLALLVAPAAVLHAKIDWGFITKSYFFVPAYNSDGQVEPLLGVGWTLLYEMMFYLIVTVAIAVRANILLFCTVVLGLCATGSLVRPEHFPAGLLYFSPLMLEFLIGMAIAKWPGAQRFPLAACGMLIVIGFLILFFRPFMSLGIILLSRSIPAGMIVLGVVGLERFVPRFPRAMVFFGAASYSLYLVHPLVAPSAPAILAKLHLHSVALSVFGSLAVAITAAAVAFYMFEKPIGDYLSARMTRGTGSKLSKI